MNSLVYTIYLHENVCFVEYNYGNTQAAPPTSYGSYTGYSGTGQDSTGYQQVNLFLVSHKLILCNSTF